MIDVLEDDKVVLHNNQLFLLVKLLREVRHMIPKDGKDALKRHDLKITEEVLNGLLHNGHEHLNELINKMQSLKEVLILQQQAEEAE